MSPALFVLYALIAAVAATPLYECGVLNEPFANYQLVNDIALNNISYGSVCFDIRGHGITLDGMGFELYSASGEMLPATGVQLSGNGATVANLRVTNFQTGIHANGKNGKVHHNTISKAINGIDVTAAHNEISQNEIRDFKSTSDSTSGIYVYFPATKTIDSAITITNNKIFNIQGDSFVIGVGIYFATSVRIANNQIYDLVGEASEAISIINGKAELVDNVFAAAEEAYLSATTMLISAVALVASAVFYRLTSSPKAPIPMPTEAEKKKMEEEEFNRRKEEKEDMEKDGVRKRTGLSFSLKASPAMSF